MLANLLPLYAASVGMICCLGLFARHNKRSGWVKQRSTIVADLIAMRNYFEEADYGPARTLVSSRAANVSTGVLSPATPSAENVSAFALQLCQLQTALKTTVPVTDSATVTEPAEKVTV